MQVIVEFDGHSDEYQISLNGVYFIKYAETLFKQE
jgi:hypothetical protein